MSVSPLLLLGLAALAASVLPSASAASLSFVGDEAAPLESRFAQWAQAFNKTYATPALREKALGAFAHNERLVAELNEGEPFQPFGMTKFSDMLPEEVRAKFLMPKETLARVQALKHASAPVATLKMDNVTLPKEFDWRHHRNAVTPVKNQGMCGSCWAFSATENIESVWALQGKHDLTELSVQQIVSCDKKDGGCSGGDLPTAFEYVRSAGGLERNAEYPYSSGEGKTGECKDEKHDELATFDGWEYATKDKNEEAMAHYLSQKAPLAICVDASSWAHYHKGILTNKCGRSLDHCVMATGFGEENGKKYWTVRNSWGTDWGEDGYIRIERGKNLCGIAEEAASVYIHGK